MVSQDEDEDDGDDEGEEEEGDEGSEEEEDEDEGPLLFGHDINAKKYINGKIELASEDVASEEALRSLHSEGFTLQVCQPQRFSDGIWRLVSVRRRSGSVQKQKHFDFFNTHSMILWSHSPSSNI